MRIVVQVAGKRIKAFKRRCEIELNLELGAECAVEGEESDENQIGNGTDDYEKRPVWNIHRCFTWHIPEDVRFGGGGCHEDFKLQCETGMERASRWCATCAHA